MNIELIRPINGETVVLMPEAMRELRKGGMAVENAENELDWRNPKLDGTERSYPVPVAFHWHCEGTKQEKAVLHLSRTADFAEEVLIEAEGCTAQADNLLIGEKYYWKVTAEGKDGFPEESCVQSFETDAQAPRLIRAEGLTNIRDLGGWKNVSGKMIRQGLFFRGSEMDTHHTLTDHARRVLRDTLKIRTDLDIRGEAVGRVTESPLGGDVRFELIPARAYGDYFGEEEKETNRRIFSVLADEEAYPVYIHCWGGADRTGTVVLLLSALLGMDDESLMQDYELTSFAIWGKRSRTTDLFQSLLTALNAYGAEGETLSVKAERYIRSTGVTQEQIGRIREILLEK